jgi:hypothetical protein
VLTRLMLALFAAVIIYSDGNRAFAQCNGYVALNDYERGAFLSAANGNRAEVSAQFLAADGCGQSMVDSLRSMGASVRFADERVGYALVMLPKGKLLDTLDLPGIAYAFVSTNRFYYFKDPLSIPPSERIVAPVPPVKISYSRVATSPSPDGPYFAAQEVGLISLWSQHPEADGRGVRVAVVDAGIDLLHPALQIALDANGNTVPKLVDTITFTTPDEDANWVRFGDQIQTHNATFEAAGREWLVPQDGSYSFGIFTNRIPLSPQSPTDPSGNNLSLSVGVLWDERSNRVWVDTDGDGSFRNERALGDYAETHDVAYFGSKKSDDDDRVPFGIKINSVMRTVYVSLANADHGTLVAGPLAGNRRTGGLFDGAAPNAQLVDMRIGSLANGAAPLLNSFERQDVDIINVSGWAGLPTENGQEDFMRHLVERAISVYDKPIACFCGDANSLFVEDYQSPEMLRRNTQLPPPYYEAMSSSVWFVEDGLVNTVLAPSASLGTQSRYMAIVVPGKDGRLYIGSRPWPPAPAGYWIGANPSPTIPIVSGILADLVSEAKRTHTRYNAARLKEAILASTRLVQGFSASEQGFGLINAADAWDQLARMAGVDDPRNPILTSFRVARKRKGQSKELNGFQADLSQAAGRLDSDLWITRRGGHVGPRKYLLELRGNDNTYHLVSRQVVFIRDKPARVRFTVAVTPGFHVAFLQLIDAETKVVMQQVPLSVRAPDVPQTIALGEEEYQAIIPPRRKDTRYIRLDKDTQAARFVMRIPSDGPSSLSLRGMPGFRYGVVGNRAVAPEAPSGAPVDATHHVGPIQEFESLIANSEAGTKPVYWGNRQGPEYETPFDPPAPDVPIRGTLIVTKYAIAFMKGAGPTVRVTNKLADIDGHVELYDAKLISSDLAGTGLHATATLDRTLPAHLSQWRIAVSSIGPEGGAVDAFVLNCTDKEQCIVADQKPLTANGAILVVEDPRQGDWKIVIRTRAQARHQIAYRVREALLVPSVCAIESADVKHASATTWSIDLPAKQSEAQYIAFLIIGPRGKNEENNGVRIAITPLVPDAP